MNTLLNATTDSRDRAMFTLMVSAGLRVGEIVELQLRDLPPFEPSNVARLRVRGKGDKERRLRQLAYAGGWKKFEPLWDGL